MHAVHPITPLPRSDLDQWIEGALKGECAAQRQLVEHLMPRVANNLIYLVSTPCDRDDILQKVLIQVLKSLNGYQHQGFYAWVDCITVRTAMRHIKKNRRWLHRFKNEPPPDLEDWQSCQHNQRELMRRRLAQALQHLSVERRTALVLKHVHGYSVKEIALMTDTLENTVRGRLRVGKKRLQTLVEQDAELRHWCTQHGLMETKRP